jgi:peptide-methionine (S)-S-oxide reductase
MTTAAFAAGCFWGIEEAFGKMNGVTATRVGYMGGHTENPTYQQVCTDTTGHAETVQIEYDPSVVSYEELLNTFWKIHNPTLLNRQGPDVGSQYRSIIFYYTPEQEKLAEVSKQALQQSGKLSGEIVTEIIPAAKFYMAEDYHQCYLKKRNKG